MKKTSLVAKTNRCSDSDEESVDKKATSSSSNKTNNNKKKQEGKDDSKTTIPKKEDSPPQKTVVTDSANGKAQVAPSAQVDNQELPTKRVLPTPETVPAPAPGNEGASPLPTKPPTDGTQAPKNSPDATGVMNIDLTPKQ